VSIQAGSKDIVETLDVSRGISIDSEEVGIDDKDYCHCDEEILLYNCDKDNTAEDLTEC
jgi:hypothetical protein